MNEGKKKFNQRLNLLFDRHNCVRPDRQKPGLRVVIEEDEVQVKICCHRAAYELGVEVEVDLARTMRDIAAPEGGSLDCIIKGNWFPHGFYVLVDFAFF